MNTTESSLSTLIGFLREQTSFVLSFQFLISQDKNQPTTQLTNGQTDKLKDIDEFVCAFELLLLLLMLLKLPHPQLVQLAETGDRSVVGSKVIIFELEASEGATTTQLL